MKEVGYAMVHKINKLAVYMEYGKGTHGLKESTSQNQTWDNLCFIVEFQLPKPTDL